jgi:hypothetical protein
MEFYLPEQEELQKYSNLYEAPIDEERVKTMWSLLEEDSRHPEIEEVFPVRSSTVLC